MINRIGIFWISVLLLITSCTGRTGTPSQADTSTISPQSSQSTTVQALIIASPTVTPTRNLPGTITKTIIPITQTPTPTIDDILSGKGHIRIPTDTPSPPSATPNPRVFPSWISDPGVDVLMTNTGTVGSIQKYLTFLNANTGERFDLPMDPAHGHFWLSDGNRFGILSNGDRDITLTDLTTGKITHYPVNQDIVRYLGIYGASGSDQSAPLYAAGSSPDGNDFFLVAFDEFMGTPPKTSVSKGNRFVVHFQINDPAHFFIEDLLHSKISEVNPPRGDIQPLDFSWSPNDNRLAILYSEPSKDRNQPTQYWLGVYDPLSNSFTKIYKGIKGVNWSPDGRKIMFDSTGYIGYQGSSEEDLQRKDTSKPCIFDLTTQNLRCLDYIRNRYGPADLGNYQWSPDGKSIAYRVSNLICVVTLATAKIDCPTQGITELKDLYINDFSWSPDGRFLEFIYDSACHACDYLDEPRIGIVSVRDGKYHLFGDFPDVPFIPRLWRPKVTL